MYLTVGVDSTIGALRFAASASCGQDRFVDGSRSRALGADRLVARLHDLREAKPQIGRISAGLSSKLNLLWLAANNHAFVVCGD
jgi:hypothetical protein